MKKDIILPEWFKYLRNDAKISAKELAGILQITTKSINEYVSSNRLPTYDWVRTRTAGGVRSSKYARKGFWRKDTILAFLKNHEYYNIVQQ